MTNVDTSNKELKQEGDEEALNESKIPVASRLTSQAQELLKLCHTIPLEVVQLGIYLYK